MRAAMQTGIAMCPPVLISSVGLSLCKWYRLVQNERVKCQAIAGKRYHALVRRILIDSRGNGMCVSTWGDLVIICWSNNAVVEKNRMWLEVFCFLWCWASVRQGIMWPPDFPATKQRVVFFCMVLAFD